MPLRRWHLGLTLVLLLFMVAVTRRFSRTPTHRLLHPRHIREIANALDYATARKSTFKEVRVGCTSLGIQISSTGIASPMSKIGAHYCLSGRGKPLTYDAAARLAGVICQLQHHPLKFKIFRGNNQVFHCFVLQPEPALISPIRQRGFPQRVRSCNAELWTLAADVAAECSDGPTDSATQGGSLLENLKYVVSNPRFSEPTSPNADHIIKPSVIRGPGFED